MGTPKRCVVPVTTSAPISPGGLSNVRLIKSAATIAIALCSWSCSMIDVRSRACPVTAGYWKMAPNNSGSSASAISPIISSKPKHSARVLMTSIVCGKQFRSTKNLFAFRFLLTRFARDIASAAAVASSSREAFAKSIAVRSRVICWKFNKHSSLPWEISG